MIVLGIDLGTTNSAACLWRDGEGVFIPNRLGDFLTPSVVSLEDGHVVVGKRARDRLITHPTETVGAFKRLMGTDHVVDLGKKHTYSPAELSSMVLRSLKEDAEAFLGETVEHAVISVPAYFSENQRQATRLAGELAGLTVNRLINEPTAAALAYELHQRPEGTFMILDLGGGTFDVSIIEYFDGVMEVHASGGDNHLGGEDFVEVLRNAFLTFHGLAWKDLTPADQQKLAARMETAKRNLKRDVPYETELELGGQTYAWTVDEGAFQREAGPLLLRLQNPIRQALYDANRSLDHIDDIVLVGGATRMAVFRSMVAKMFKRMPKLDRDPDLAIALGVAVQGGLSARDGSLEDVVLTDVCPYSLGIAVTGGDTSGAAKYFSPIIERNTIVPVSRVEQFSTVNDNQVEIAVEIFQGESRFVADNVYLSTLTVPVPRAAAGKESISVRFSYDVNGLLDVDVTVDSSGRTYRKTVENRSGELSPKEVEASLKRLSALKFHPRDAEENKALMARADRLYQTLLGVDREQIGAAMQTFAAVLERQNPQEIKRVREDLERLFDSFDQDLRD